MESTLNTPRQSETADGEPRPVVIRTRGRRHGPIARLVSPHDLGERLKPFVFLDHAEVPFTGKPLFGIHPHSGIATLTVVLRGTMVYEDTTGKKGFVPAGGFEWMKAGNGVWHDGGPGPGDPLRLFQLWVALPPAEENAPPESQYIDPEEVEEEGPARVVLGQLGAARSRIHAPSGIDYFHVRLKDGEHWRYTPPAGQAIAWLAVDRGRLRVPQAVDAGELIVFDQSTRPVDVRAEAPTSFVFGAAAKHPHPLITGYYSVHTSAESLARGEAEIERIGRQLRAQGRR